MTMLMPAVLKVSRTPRSPCSSTNSISLHCTWDDFETGGPSQSIPQRCGDSAACPCETGL